MNNDSRLRRAMAVGSVVGAILGAGSAYLLIKAPSEPNTGEERKPISGTEIVTLTSAAAMLIRRLDDFRRRLK